MTYGDENATFEPLPEMLRNARQAGLNLSTRERLRKSKGEIESLEKHCTD